MAGTIVVDRIESDSSYSSTINVAAKVNFTGGMQVGGQDSPFGGMRNRIINGDMRIDQRNNGSANTIAANTAPHIIDRYYHQSYGNGRITVQRDSDIPTSVGVANSMSITCNTAQSVFASNDVYETVHQIEGLNLSDLKWGTAQAKPCVLTFWVKSSLTGTYPVSVQDNSTFNYAGFDSCCTNYTINQANTWEKKTIVIPPPTGGNYAHLNKNLFAIQVRWCLGNATGDGRTGAATSGQWTSGNVIKLSGTTYASWMSTVGNTWKMTGVQFEVGSSPTEFEQRSGAQELALCQRYYEKFHWVVSNYYNGSNGCGTAIPFKVTKRATPSLVIDNLNWGSWNVNYSAMNADDITTERLIVNPTGGSTGFLRVGADFSVASEY